MNAFVVREFIKGGSQRYIGVSVSRGMSISILYAGFAGVISCMLLVIEIMNWSCNSCNSRGVCMAKQCDAYFLFGN